MQGFNLNINFGNKKQVVLKPLVCDWKYSSEVVPTIVTSCCVHQSGHGDSLSESAAYNRLTIGRYGGDNLKQVVLKPLVFFEIQQCAHHHHKAQNNHKRITIFPMKLWHHDVHPVPANNQG